MTSKPKTIWHGKIGMTEKKWHKLALDSLWMYTRKREIQEALKKINKLLKLLKV